MKIKVLGVLLLALAFLAASVHRLRTVSLGSALKRRAGDHDGWSQCPDDTGIAFVVKTGSGRRQAQWALDTWLRPQRAVTLVSDAAGTLLPAASTSQRGPVPIFNVLRATAQDGAALDAFVASPEWRLHKRALHDTHDAQQSVTA